MLSITRKTVYACLADKMLTYSDYAQVPALDNGEPLVPISSVEGITFAHIDPLMAEFTGGSIYVRAQVACLLANAAEIVNKYDRKLHVVYGYRPLSVQRKLFAEQKARLASHYYDAAKLMEATHRIIAVPEVAGHPAGAAVDLTLTQAGQPCDMGTSLWDFRENSFTFSPFVSRTAWENRQLLRRVMMQVGFAPFDGEWWHFSYGDKEWARYYSQQHALYEQVEFSTATGEHPDKASKSQDSYCG